MAGIFTGYTMKQAKARLAADDMTITHDADSGDYRVNFKGGGETTAYYTDSIVDAIATGIDMACRKREQS